jgi:hypothetical protein
MSAASDDRPVPAHARALAARLSALFDRDVEIVKQLNHAHDTPQQIHWQIHHAFSTYQDASEQRRQLAVDVGEISQQFTTALCTAGYSAQQARQANVHQLAEQAPP